MLMLRVLKQTSWRAYKDIVNSMKLGLQDYKKKTINYIIRTEHPGLEGWESSNEVSYEKIPYTPEIIKAELSSRHPNDTLAGGSESKRAVDWPGMLLIRMTFESLRRDIKTYIKELLRLLLVKSLGQSHVAVSSCYQRRLVNRCIYQFGHEIAYFHRLERQQLWFASRHCDRLTKIVFYTIRQSRLRSMPPTLRKSSST